MSGTPAASTSNSSYSWVGPLISGLSGYFGSNSAANAQAAGESNAINTQSNLESTLNNIFSAQSGAGNPAFTTMGNQLGISGTPNYAAFNNSPGFQFATQMGEQAINREAAAQGNLYTPNTLMNIGNYAQGMASQNYNNYMQQLSQLAGFGAQANQGLSSGISSAATNISQAQQNQGNANASGSAGQAGAIAGAASQMPWGSVISGVGNLVSNLFSPSLSSSANSMANSAVSDYSNNFNLAGIPGVDTGSGPSLNTSGFNSGGF